MLTAASAARMYIPRAAAIAGCLRRRCGDGVLAVDAHEEAGAYDLFGEEVFDF
jgi:hypothetical protein